MTSSIGRLASSSRSLISFAVSACGRASSFASELSSSITCCDEQRGAEGEEEGEEEEFVLNSGTDWAKLETRALTGTKAEEPFSFDVPLEARGIWDLVVSVVDAEGNAAPDVITQVHVENDYIPAFILQAVDGVNPSTWQEEPMWAPGAEVTVTGSVEDSDGVSEAEVLLIRGSDETVVWSESLVVSGEASVTFTVQVVVPADAEVGEYHFEMEATDGTGVEMHTGFHVEVE